MLHSWHRIAGGTARAAESLGRELAATGEVDLVGIAPLGWGRWGRKPAHLDSDFPVRHLPAPHQLIYESWHRLRLPPVQWVTGTVDIVHATTATVPPAAGARLVVSIHDLFPLQYPEMFTSRGLAMLGRGIELARTEADVVLVPSEATRQDCLHAGFREERLRIVPLGADTVAVDPVRAQALERRYGLNRPFVLWVGTAEPRKNLATLVAAMEHLLAAPDAPDAELILVGPGGWHLDLDALLHGRDRIRHLGFVDDHDLAALYSMATVTALPSHAEGFGLTAIESLTHATPVVVSAGSATAEVVGDAGVVVPATDEVGWATALGDLLRHPDQAAAMGEAGRAHAAGFTWQHCAAETLAAYRSLFEPDGV
jgi:glycosyltransferase involved in cell wall biosynthesis